LEGHAHGTPLHDAPVCLICGCHWLQVKYDLVIGADGVGSTVRSEMEHQLPGMSDACPLLRLYLCFSLCLQSITIADRCAQVCVECYWYKLLGCWGCCALAAVYKLQLMYMIVHLHHCTSHTSQAAHTLCDYIVIQCISYHYQAQWEMQCLLQRTASALLGPGWLVARSCPAAACFFV